MALGSWQGLYNAVIDELMDDQKEQELLLLMVIAKHANRFGFCFPGRARLMARRRISLSVYERRLTYLVEHAYVRVIEEYDWFRGQKSFMFQVSPRVLYIREEFQEYCEKVFDGIEERNFSLEKWFTENHFGTNDSVQERRTENHFSTNDSQPETEPETEPDSVTRPRNHTQTPETENQRSKSASKQKVRNTSTTGNAQAKPDQREAQQDQRRPARNSKNHPQAGGPDGDEFSALLSPTVDNDRLIREIMHVVSTTEHQAREVVEIYPRDAIVYWLRMAAIRRAKGELKKPGGWFFSMLRSQTPFPKEHWPDEWKAQDAYQDKQNNQSDSEMEI